MEELGAHARHWDLFRLGSFSQIDVLESMRRDIVEDIALLSPIVERLCASDRGRYSARGDEANERVRIWRLEWTQDDGTDNGEDRGIGPNAERQRQD